MQNTSTAIATINNQASDEYTTISLKKYTKKFLDSTAKLSVEIVTKSTNGEKYRV